MPFSWISYVKRGNSSKNYGYLMDIVCKEWQILIHLWTSMHECPSKLHVLYHFWFNLWIRCLWNELCLFCCFQGQLHKLRTPRLLFEKSFETQHLRIELKSIETPYHITAGVSKTGNAINDQDVYIGIMEKPNLAKYHSFPRVSARRMLYPDYNECMNVIVVNFKYFPRILRSAIDAKYSKVFPKFHWSSENEKIQALFYESHGANLNTFSVTLLETISLKIETVVFLPNIRILVRLPG